MLRFGIDIDGTTTTNDWLFPFIEKDFNIKIDPEEIVEYDLTHIFDGDQEKFTKWYLKNESELFRNPPLRLHVKDIFVNWAKHYELYFISARGEHVLQVTKDWFKQTEIPYHHLELIGSHDKIETAKKFQVDIFFEDTHDNAVNISESCGIPVILFDSPYNRMPVPESVIRVENWLEAKDWVDNWIQATN